MELFVVVEKALFLSQRFFEYFFCFVLFVHISVVCAN